MQPNCLSRFRNVLVATYYDQSTKNSYLSTVPRSIHDEQMRTKGDHMIGEVWRAHVDELWYRTPSRKLVFHAEDSAYYLQDYDKPLEIPPGSRALQMKYGDGTENGSEIAVWGVMGLDENTDVKTLDTR